MCKSVMLLIQMFKVFFSGKKILNLAHESTFIFEACLICVA